MQGRHFQLIEEHLAPLQSVAAGLRALPHASSAFASTQAAWRFYKNPRTRLNRLVQPLIDHARRAAATACDEYILVPHDWSLLHYDEHLSKQDRVALGNSQDLGYELLTSLAVSDRDGSPLAAVCQQLRGQAGVYSTRSAQRLPDRSQLDMLAPVLAHVEGLALGKPLVHIIDAEADSIAHYRLWARQGRQFLVRADKERVVLFQGQERSLAAVAALLWQRGAFTKSRSVTYRGRQTQQWVAEAEVILHRPARPQRRGQPRVVIPGRPLRLRLVVGELRAEGALQERWLLLTNVPAAVPAERVVLWYYWRWQLETYFKLLKGAGLHLEQWQQASALAVAKRLLVAGMACALVWELARAPGPEAETLRALLVRLSGRQMQWGKSYTEPALLAGLWVLLSLLEVLDHYDLETLRQFGQRLRPSPDPPKSG